MSSRPWDIRLRRLEWEAVPKNYSVRRRVRILMLLGLPLARQVDPVAAQHGEMGEGRGAALPVVEVGVRDRDLVGQAHRPRELGI